MWLKRTRTFTSNEPGRGSPAGGTMTGPSMLEHRMWSADGLRHPAAGEGEARHSEGSEPLDGRADVPTHDQPIIGPANGQRLCPNLFTIFRVSPGSW